MAAPLRLQDAIATIQHAFDLGETEAAIYVHLCLAGPAKAGDLANALKLHRNEVYRNTTRLLARGLTEMTLERPARYAAVDAQAVFHAEIASRLAAVEELKHARDQVSPLLTQIQLHVGPPSKNTYKIIQGRADIYATRERIIEEARERVEWCSTFPPEVSLSDLSGAHDILKRRVDEGLSFRGIFQTTPSGWQKLERFRGLANVDIRTSDQDRTVRFVIVDGEQLLMWVVNDPSESLHAKDEVAIHTTAPGFVQAEGLFFEQTWAKSKPAVGVGAKK